jgi:hypothetical protein
MITGTFNSLMRAKNGRNSGMSRLLRMQSVDLREGHLADTVVIRVAMDAAFVASPREVEMHA